MEAERSVYNHYVYCDIGWHCVQELTSVQAVLGAFLCCGVPIFCMSIIRDVTRIIRAKG